VQSPYPLASTLRAYAAFDPDLVKRVLDNTDLQIAHRHQMERDLMTVSERRRDRGQIFAFTVAMSGTVGAFVAGYLGVPSLVCVVAIVFCIGGPNAATILARVLDRRQG
jgi:uncharacterized membrane protein